MPVSFNKRVNIFPRDHLRVTLRCSGGQICVPTATICSAGQLFLDMFWAGLLRNKHEVIPLLEWDVDVVRTAVKYATEWKKETLGLPSFPSRIAPVRSVHLTENGLEPWNCRFLQAEFEQKPQLPYADLQFAQFIGFSDYARALGTFIVAKSIVQLRSTLDTKNLV